MGNSCGSSSPPAPVVLRPATLVRCCRSRVQGCLLGPLPPRSPGHVDPQVPTLRQSGPLLYARLAHLYFYLGDALDDPAFGFRDLEVSIAAPVGDASMVELYGVGDGYQTGRGCGRGQPLFIDLLAGETRVATVPWTYPDVLDGHADPMTLSTRVSMTPAQFASLTALRVPPCDAFVLTQQET